MNQVARSSLADGENWPELYALLRERDAARMTAGDLEVLADAAWWMCRVEDSVEVRQRAHAAYARDGDLRRAGYNAWMLSTEYHFIGKPAASAGWLQKAQRHLRDEPECAEQGFIMYSMAEMAEGEGNLDEAERLARQMIDIGVRCRHRDLTAMGQMMLGRVLISKERVRDGLALIDEVMSDVIGGELSSLTTGWLYCLAVPICFDLADLRRATEWNDSAMSWCSALPMGTPFHGVCRIHHVELLGLVGAWETAGREAERACNELMAYHPHMAGDSFYVTGELRRREGDLQGAERAFVRAHELGREPQPGLALVRLEQGKIEAAAAGLRSAAVTERPGTVGRARLLAAQVEVALAANDHVEAWDTAAELTAMAEKSGAALFTGLAASCRGAVALSENDIPTALDHLRRARRVWLELNLPYETAQTRTLLGSAARMAGDHETARRELQAARSTFERLGSKLEMRRVEALLADNVPLPGGLTKREVEVLRLVAAGKTNREVAEELVISHHTVKRHLNNIYAKLGVSTRAAAGSFAHTHDLL